MYVPEGARLARALQLLSQGRHDLAETEAQAAIAEDPRQSRAYAAFALCLSKREKHTDAVAAAQQAVSLEPGLAWNHLVLADVLLSRNSFEDGLKSAQAAVALDPGDAHAHTCEARALLLLKRYAESLEASQRALGIDAHNTDAGNVRAAALRSMGRRKEAVSEINNLLSANPNSAFSHTNMGWSQLHRGQAKLASTHFREALRIQPSNESARQGLIESLRARSPIYNIILRYFLFMNRLSLNAQWSVLLGGWVLYQIFRYVKSSSPQYAGVMNIFIGAYLVFAALTLLSRPLHTLALFLHPLGRHALTRREKIGAAIFWIAMVVPLVFLALYSLSIAKDFNLVGAMLTAILIIPVSLATESQSGTPRIVMGVIAGVLSLSCLLLLFLVGMQSSVFGLLLAPYVISCFASVWVSNALAIRKPDVKR